MIALQVQYVKKIKQYLVWNALLLNISSWRDDGLWVQGE